jgi:hypothetical protein
MFTYYFRLFEWILIVTVLVVMVTILLGFNLPTDAVIEYRVLDGATYPIFIRVSDRAFKMILAGARCFRSPPANPEWIATRHQYQPSYYPETFEILYAQSDDALNQIRCEHFQRLHLRITARTWQLLHNSPP